jgi:predicted O-methyltransferase YrrM
MLNTKISKYIPLKVKNFLKQKWKLYRELTSGVWAKKNHSDLDDFCNSIDPIMWHEAKTFSSELDDFGMFKISNTKIQLGGSAAFPLLYFLARKIKPNMVIETGVASGWSSAAFLNALNKNNNGYLFSSDLPYPHIEGSADLIGLVVEEKLKKRWKLYLEGDSTSLPLILTEVGAVDLFHYDSQKSIKGREFAWNLIKNKLSNNAIVIFDDIQDNFHFKKLIEELNCDYRIFQFKRKYLGIFAIGNNLENILGVN